MHSKKKYVLLTGATGFIGSSLVETLLEHDCSPILLVRKASNIKKFDLYGNRVTFVRVNFDDVHSVQHALGTLKQKGVELHAIIYGLGATKAKNREAYYHINYQYLTFFYQALQQSQISCRQFVYISSLSPHGPLRDASQHLGLGMPFKPLTFYGKSKWVADKFVRKHFANYIIVRPAAVYGPHDKEALILFKALNKRIALFLGSKRHKIGIIHAKDLALIIQLALPLQGKYILYACTHNVSVRYYYQMISKQLGKKTRFYLCFPSWLLFFIASVNEFFCNYFFGKQPMFNKQKVAELVGYNWTCDNYTYTKQLNWTSEKSFEERMKETVAWYKKAGWL